MSNAAIQPDLIIALSQDRVRLKLTENPEAGRAGWQTSFEVDNIFLEDQMAQSLDRALLEYPTLIDQFPCVEIVVLDRPNICVSRHYLDSGKLGEIASRHLRLRAGDTLNTDASSDDFVFCYSLPTETLLMMKEYYANIGCSHLSSILWHSFSSHHPRPEKDAIRLYFTVLRDTLVLLGEKNKKLIFSKSFTIRDKADLFYYAIACSRMLKTKELWLVTIEDEEVQFEFHGESILKIDKYLQLPSLHVLMSQYKVCES